ncbi:RNA polymerase factor sigma-54 [Pseudalkalibacillus hwajinpoensis]|uniref:RNA polymerase factor sigma-54 n=1 Tax=Guptibacillus hwajinpoensis TaxID=208199 RepID=A0A4U1MKI6_9BACL|nr:RNA polymerase factor sigma-54 [Pseudalkalibacillus hwajinpoensis]TKD71032.1 RNA polymerase factor sigma-54 [Pseudalkalibacillus hwajinpoensis]
MELGLVQKQTTKLVMTTQLHQAISILQYSTAELLEYVKEQALENPLIELQSSSWEGGVRSSKRVYDGESKKDPLEYAESRKSLQDELHEQARCLKLSRKIEGLVHYLIDNVDDAGYLRLNEFEMMSLLHVQKEEIDEAVRHVQLLDPIGIGARSLSECLYLQLNETNSLHALAREIVQENLKALAEKKFRDLAKEYNVSVGEIQRAGDLIATLDPRPGAKWAVERPSYIVPDVMIEEKKGAFTITLLDDELPAMKVSNDYESFKTIEAAEYLKDKYQQVNWLLKSIQQRKQTLRAIMKVFILHQQSFLKFGIGDLAPLTLKEVAIEANVHESTVSRAIKSKYVQTPHGLFALKDLFTSRLSSDSIEGTSSSSVKLFIKELVENESKLKPLSDQKIVEALHIQKGVEVSRRTIAKYRDELNIVSSSKRKRFV